VNDRPVKQKNKWPFLMIFDENTRKLLQAGSDRNSAMAIDRRVAPKLKWSIFDDFCRQIPNFTPDLE
jgi:phage gp37-like protein